MKEETLAQFMKKDRNKYLDWLLKFLGVIVIIGIIVIYLYGPVNYNGFSVEKCQKMGNIFEVSWRNKKTDTALACMIENPDMDTISAKTVLHKNELGEGDGILFRSRQCGVKVYLDDDLIYDSGEPFDYPFLLGYGAFWRSVKLGDDYDGKILTIELKPEYEMQAVSGYLPNIFWGTQPAFMLMILETTLIYLVLTVFLIVLGCVMMFYALPLVRKKRSSKFFFLALFSIDTGLWMLIETHILEMFVRNIPVVIYLSYFTYGMMPVLLVRFLLSYEEFKKKIYLQLLYLGGILLNILQLFWSMTGICSEFEAQGLNRIYLGLMIIGLIALLLSARNAEKEERKLYIGISILVLSTVLELGYFLLIDKKNSGRILIIGICLFVINSGISLIREVRVMQKSDIERDILVKMAYTDGMTQLGNRFAYDQEKSRLESLENVRIIILIADMNGLKKVNDSYGHSYGDQIICKTAEILQDSFQNLGKCFRLGGDEFCVLAENVERTVFETGVRYMEEKAATLQANIEGYGISFGIAEGVSRDIEDIYHIADNLMYSQKRTINRKDRRGNKK